MHAPAQGFARPIILLIMAMLFALAFGASAQDGEAGGQPMLLPLDATPLIVTTAKGDVRFSIEVADTGEERANGLMFRREMPDDRGMLFVFEETRRVAFWMKNTPMPLDLLFVEEDGTIGAIMQGTPFSEAPISPPVAARFVLELKSGTSARTGVAVGDRLRHPRIDAIAAGR